MNNSALDAILVPKSIAVVGASATPGKIGFTVVNNLLKDGYTGKIFPVNPTATDILGLKVYASVKDIPETVEAAVITVPAKFVADVVRRMRSEGDQRTHGHHVRFW